MMKAVALLSALFATTSALDPMFEFGAFVERFNKTYTNDAAEFKKRYGIFAANHQMISKHNELHAMGNESFELGVNQFSDMTPEEFKKAYLGFRADIQAAWPAKNIHEVSGNPPPADGVDWRTKNLVNPIKNQEQCGSCWAFSAIVGLEGQYSKKNKKLTSLSEQDLVDCVKDVSVPSPFGAGNASCCDGCGGGIMNAGFEYLMEHQKGDAEAEATYPYTATAGQCSYNAAKVVQTDVTGYKVITAKDEKALKDAVTNIGPITIGVDASSWQSYKGGVFNGGGIWIFGKCSSDPHKMDHGVAIVGYGTDNKTNAEYWIIRNSWGTVWGEEGYMKLAMGKNLCGVANAASYPILA